MNLFSNIRNLLVALLAASALTACNNSFIFEDEGDCDPKYRVKLRYDWNMKYADAFAAEVDHVTVNVIDADGRIVYTHQESGEALKANNYEIVLDGALKPGKYRLHAWCGSGAEPGNTSFMVHPAETLEDLCCTLLPDPDAARGRAEITGADGQHIQRPLGNLYHGLTEDLSFPEEEGVHSYTIPLVKNTNSVKVMLQHLSDVPLDGEDFEFIITSRNARMAHDNSIIDSDAVTYHAWDVRTYSGTIAPDPDNGLQGGTHDAVVAEYTIGRLMANEDVRLEAYRKKPDGERGDLAFSVDMVRLALMLKSANISQMDNQEFLDRQDEYNFIFFLDSNYRWTRMELNILSWKLVQQNTDI
ncbi:MAG: FimB/Mfa2 family fimbrial subunit [Muribaculaceae bacterium]|nr:FimB/Mfa2 family fimbrial subunit [Muribaculaceae bacterium]